MGGGEGWTARGGGRGYITLREVFKKREEKNKRRNGGTVT